MVSKAKVEVKCPVCLNRGIVKVEENILNNNKNGLIAMNIDKLLICKHSFVSYIDNDFIERDSFVCDFKIELPEFEIKELEDRKNEIEVQNMNLHLILINLSASVLIWIIRSCLLKKKMVVIDDLIILKPEIKKLMKYAFQDKFEIDNLSIITEAEYKNNKKKYNDHIIVKNKKIVNDKKKLFISSKIKVESTIIQRLLTELDQIRNLIIFKNDIQKTFMYAKDIIKLLENYNGKEQLGKKQLIEMIGGSKRLNIRYLDLLLDIIKHYFNFKHPSLPDYIIPAFGI